MICVVEYLKRSSERCVHALWSREESVSAGNDVSVAYEQAIDRRVSVLYR